MTTGAITEAQPVGRALEPSTTKAEALPWVGPPSAEGRRCCSVDIAVSKAFSSEMILSPRDLCHTIWLWC